MEGGGEGGFGGSGVDGGGAAVGVAEELLDDGYGHPRKASSGAVMVTRGASHSTTGGSDGGAGAQPSQQGVNELLVERLTAPADDSPAR